MIKTARQLKDLIRNLSREKSVDAQILMRNYMMERFLERISLSEYRDKFILKGGMLVAAMKREIPAGICVRRRPLCASTAETFKHGENLTPQRTIWPVLLTFSSWCRRGNLN